MVSDGATYEPVANGVVSSGVSAEAVLLAVKVSAGRAAATTCNAETNRDFRRTTATASVFGRRTDQGELCGNRCPRIPSAFS